MPGPNELLIFQVDNKISHTTKYSLLLSGFQKPAVILNARWDADFKRHFLYTSVG